MTKTYITTITTMTNILANSCNTVTSIGKRPLCFFLLKPGTENSEIFELLYFYIFAAACFKTRQICYRALWLKWERRSEPFFPDIVQNGCCFVDHYYYQIVGGGRWIAVATDLPEANQPSAGKLKPGWENITGYA